MCKQSVSNYKHAFFDVIFIVRASYLTCKIVVLCHLYELANSV